LTRFILRRILLSIPVLFGVVVVVFLIARVLPGDPCHAALGERATKVVCDAYIHRVGLDQPLPVQFALYLRQLLSGDLGISLKFGRPVGDLLIERFPTTVELTIYALVFATFFGVLLGLVSAYRRNSKIDVGAMVLANIGVSTPVFVIGLLLSFAFGVILKDSFLSLPPSGRLSAGLIPKTIPQAWGLGTVGGPVGGLLQFLSGIYLISATVTGQWNVLVDSIRHMILPAIALGTIPLAIIARMTRSSLLDVLGLDYIRTARAKGLGNRLVIFRHAMKNAMLPVVTVIGLSLGGLLSGAILTETIFGLTGLGRTLFEAITGRDYVLIQGFTLIIAVFYMVVNLLVDISYAKLDPRIRLS
jgi:peptide/nickel transport system permease protein